MRTGKSAQSQPARRVLRRALRLLSFERLDQRAVLSTSGSLGAALGVEMPHVDFPAPQAEVQHGSVADAPRYDGKLQDAWLTTDPHGGHSSFDDGRYETNRFMPSMTPPLVPLGFIVDASPLGLDGSVLVLTVGGWNGLGYNNAWSNLMSLEFLSTMPPRPSSPPTSAPLSSPQREPNKIDAMSIAHSMGTDVGVEQAVGSAIGSRSNVDAPAFGGVTAIALPATVSAHVGLQAAPSAEALPIRIDPPRTPSVPSPDGGLIELDAGRTRKPLDFGDRAEDSASATKRRESDEGQRLEELWGKIAALLAEAELASTDLDASRTRPEVAAGFDDGGAIELAAGRTAPQGDADGTVRAAPIDDVEITIDAGVALFQAFELGTLPVETPPPVDVPVPPASARREDEQKPDAPAKTDSAAHRAAANVGLGMLAVVPLAMLEKRSADGLHRARRSHGDRR